MATQRLTNDIISAAIEGFESQKKRIDGQIAELRQMLTGGESGVAATLEPRKGRPKMSAAGRRAIAVAQRKRWAAIRKASQPVSAKAPKPKRRLSAAGKKRIIEATRRRWAAFRAQKAAAQKAAAKSGKKGAA
jgi:hypothetical protein